MKSQIEFRYYTEQKFGIIKPNRFNIPKYLLKKYLPKNAVMIDCGAHIGEDSVELARIFPAGIVYSFEAVPQVFAKLKHTVRRFKNIICNNIALSDKTGVSKMYVSSGSYDGSSSLLAPKEHLADHPDVLFNETVEVNTISLDDWAGQNKIEKVDLLWLDMQGYEYPALKASAKVLPLVKVIHTEVSTRETYENVTRYDELKNFLQQQGFTEVYKALPEGADMGNILFVRI
jgi:FkbM family methyltransferase